MALYWVKPGESLTLALAKLQPGDTLLVRAGKYEGKR